MEQILTEHAETNTTFSLGVNAIKVPNAINVRLVTSNNLTQFILKFKNKIELQY